MNLIVKRLSKLNPHQIFLLIVAAIAIMIMLSVTYRIHLDISSSEPFSTCTVMDPNNPACQSCSELVKQKFPKYKFTNDSLDIIGALAPGLSTEYSDTGVEKTFAKSCVVREEDIDSFSLEKKTNPLTNEVDMCVNDSLGVRLPYNNNDNNGCEILLNQYADNEGSKFEELLIKLYGGRKPNLQQQKDITQNTRDIVHDQYVILQDDETKSKNTANSLINENIVKSDQIKYIYQPQNQQKLNELQVKDNAVQTIRSDKVDPSSYTIQPVRPSFMESHKCINYKDCLENGPYTACVDAAGGEFIIKQGAGTIWRSGKTTRDTANARLCMQSDGNLVSYDSKGAYWASHTWTSKPKPIYKASLSNNGNFEIRDREGKIIWQAKR